jgi:hypothetical protein
VVGPVDDPYEQEADRVADQVMRMPDTDVPETSEKDPGPVIQRLCTDCEGEEQSIQGKRDGGPTGEVSAKQTSEIESIRSGGEPLRPASRDFFEQRFGHDFSSVRIHSDDRAARSAQGIHALAYTTGPHIVFGAGHYSPDTHAGQKLLAHELTHVVQQGSGGPRRIQRTAKFVKGTPSPEINPAQQIAENKIPTAELYFGQTNFLLNGKNFTDAGDDEIKKSLNRPAIGHKDIQMPVGGAGSGSGSGSGAPQKTVPFVECWLDSVPDNVGSYEMKLLTKGSFSFVTDKTNVGKRFPSLKPCKDGFGKVTFVLKGDSDALRKRVQAHEKHHAEDDEAVFNDVLGGWDKYITDTHKQKLPSKAPNQSLCERGLFRFGDRNNNPDDMVINLARQIEAKGVAFHRRPEGARPNVKPEQPDSSCNQVNARAEYPD